MVKVVKLDVFSCDFVQLSEFSSQTFRNKTNKIFIVFMNSLFLPFSLQSKQKRFSQIWLWLYYFGSCRDL
jgi:hypothetical protein